MVSEVAAAVSEKPMARISLCVTGWTDGQASEEPMPTQKNGKRLVTALLSWWPIYTPHLGHLKLAGVSRSLVHIQEHLQAIQVQIDQILRLSTSFVSVSARISSLESVIARCCVLWLVLEWTTLIFRCAGLLGALVARRHVNDPLAWCGAASTTCAGDGDPSFMGKLP